MPSTSQPSRARAHEPEGRAAHSSSPACFEPFGEDWSNARSFGLNLRRPGQWDDDDRSTFGSRPHSPLIDKTPNRYPTAGARP